VVNETHNQSVGGVSVSNNNLGNSPKSIYGNSGREESLFTSRGNIKYQDKSHQQLKGSVSLSVYHQSIKGLRGKVNELISQLHLTFPHVLCLSEHHRNYLGLQQTFLDGYSLGDSYCRVSYEKGGVCVFVQEKLRYTSIDLAKYCNDKDFGVCAIKIYLHTKKVCIITIYRAPSGSFDIFVTKLDAILKKLYCYC
jgi:hypothetical protein